MAPKPPKSGSRDSPKKPSDPEGRAFLALLSEADRARLAVRCAVAPGADPTEGILAYLATSSGARRMLAAIEHDAREALLAIYMIGDLRGSSETERLLRVVHGWTLARTKSALDLLHGHVLLAERATVPPTLVPIATLARGLGHDLIVWLTGGAPDAPPAPPFVRRLALLLAHIHADPVQRTQQHVPAVRWLERAATIFEPMGFPRQLLVNLIAWLGTVGALHSVVDDTGGDTAHVAADADKFLRRAPDDLAFDFAARDDTNPAGSLIAALVALERALQAGNAQPTIGDLTKVAMTWLERRFELGLPYAPEDVSIWGTGWGIRRLRILGLVEVTPKDDTVVVRRIEAARLDATFRCTVLPTFDILVGADAEPGGTAALGRIADLVSADHVARFALTSASLARAAREPGGADAAIEWLASVAEHGLPDAVRATITGWARRAHTMQLYEGAVVVADTPEHATWLREQAYVGDEIAPNVFRIAAGEVGAFRKAAAAAKMPLVRSGATESIGKGDGFGKVARSAADVRDRIARWAKPFDGKATGAPKGRDRRDTYVPDLSDDEEPIDDDGVVAPTNVSELREEWPNVARAIRKVPELLEVVFRMPLETLDEVEFETTSTTEILRAITAWKRMHAEDDAPEARDDAPTAKRAEPTPASQAPTEAGTWTTMPIGALTAWLGHAASAGLTVEIVYVNASGVRSERKVVPLNIARAGRREWLDARDLTTGSTTRFDLDRIAAVRET